MIEGTSLIDLPARYSARVILIRLIESLDTRRQAYLEAPDVERLHDLRVAMRRVRSFVRTYRELFRGTKLKPLLRRLRRTAKATNKARDIDVQLEWLRAQAESLRPEERPGLSWLSDRLEAEARAQYQRARRGIKAELKKFSKDGIEISLSSYRVPVDHASPEGEDAFGEALASALEEGLAELHQLLGTRDDRGLFDRSHAARLAGKRLRYLIEPVVDELPGGKAFLKQLKRLQDDLGELNDARVHAEEVAVVFEEIASAAPVAPGGERQDPAPGLIALARLLHSRKRASFDKLSLRWAGESGRERLAGGQAIIDYLRHGSQPAREIERKYLLATLPPEVDRAESAELEQGYLPGSRIIERIRRITDRNGVRCFRTMKLGRGVSRIEVEEPMPPDLFEELWPLTEGKRVHKRRFRLNDGSLTWEVDQFLDRELLLAEVELPTVEAPSLPPWLVSHVKREVTDEAEYTNVNLAC